MRNKQKKKSLGVVNRGVALVNVKKKNVSILHLIHFGGTEFLFVNSNYEQMSTLVFNVNFCETAGRKTI